MVSFPFSKNEINESQSVFRLECNQICGKQRERDSHHLDLQLLAGARGIVDCNAVLYPPCTTVITTHKRNVLYYIASKYIVNILKEIERIYQKERMSRNDCT